jgi:hypothetical protein
MPFGDTLPDSALRPDVRKVAHRFERHFGVSSNTYVGHGTSTSTHTGDNSRQNRSVDFWSPIGRGAPIKPEIGNRIVQRLRRRKKDPQFQYIIWQGWILYPSGVRFAYMDRNDLHFDHVHVTFV